MRTRSSSPGRITNSRGPEAAGQRDQVGTQERAKPAKSNQFEFPRSIPAQVSSAPECIFWAHRRAGMLHLSGLRGAVSMGSNGAAALGENRVSFWRRNRWLVWVAGASLTALATVAVLVAIVLHRAEPFLRARIVSALEDRFHGRVELDSFHMSLIHGLRAEGKGLRIWPPAQADGASDAGGTGSGEPLIRLAEFHFRAPLHYEPGKPFQIRVVELEGLDVHLPPRSHFEHVSSGADSSSGGMLNTTSGAHDSGTPLVSFSVDRLDCKDARLVLETSKPGKLPQEIAIAFLKLTGVSSSQAMGFEAELTNPRPVGTIHTKGEFGPSPGPDLGESPVQGEYVFNHADLSVFKGIAGILSSTGHYDGTLRDLTVDGQTDTPDFQLRPFNNPLPLHTNFHAKVDGTNGDTWLQPVDATLGHSHFTAQGKVVRVVAPAEGGRPPVSKGHDISLDVNVDRARIEDFLRLASHSATSLMTGAVTAKSTLHIPPGPEHVVKRLGLNGSFKLDGALFTSTKIQEDIRQLSLRGQGRPQDVKRGDPAVTDSDFSSSMRGDFKMEDAVSLSVKAKDKAVLVTVNGNSPSYGLLMPMITELHAPKTFWKERKTA